MSRLAVIVSLLAVTIVSSLAASQERAELLGTTLGKIVRLESMYHLSLIHI